MNVLLFSRLKHQCVSTVNEHVNFSFFIFIEALPVTPVNESENPEIDLTQGFPETDKEALPVEEEKLEEQGKDAQIDAVAESHSLPQATETQESVAPITSSKTFKNHNFRTKVLLDQWSPNHKPRPVSKYLLGDPEVQVSSTC